MPRRTGRHGNQWAVVERLEDRLLLAAGPVVIGDAAGADAKSLVYHDTDGTQVTVSLKGGNATVNWVDPNTTWQVVRGVATAGAALGDTAEIDVLDLAGTGAASVLTITPKVVRLVNSPFPSPNKTAGLNAILCPTAIGKIVAAGINIAGSDQGGTMTAIHVGGIGTCTIGDVTGAALLDLGGAAADSLTFTGGQLGGAWMTFGGTIKQLTVAGWADGGEVTAAALGKVTASAGSLAADLTATGAGGIGSISVTAGDLAGAVSAASGAIGAITVLAKAVYDNSTTPPTPQVLGGSITGNITAGAGKTNAIASITVTGGTLGTLDAPITIAAAGPVGTITNKGLSYRDYYVADTNKVKTANSYQECGVFAGITSTAGGIGKISVTGGEFSGSITASKALAGITVSSATVNDPVVGPIVFGGALTGQIAAASIGPVTTTGGDFDAVLTAGAIGTINVTGGNLTGTFTSAAIANITCKAVTTNAKATEPDVPGAAAGGIIADLTLEMVAAGAKLGAVKAVGGQLSVLGHVSFDPASAKLVSQAVTYVAGYEVNDLGQPVAVRQTVGGPDQVTNGLLAAP